LFWGPRFFLFGCFVAALVLARRAARAGRLGTGANLLTLGALVLSGWVAVCGLTFQLKGSEQYISPATKEVLVLYVPECSALWWPLVDPEKARAAPELYRFSQNDWLRAAAVALGFCYLAVPVVRALVQRAPGYAGAGWSAARAGPRWRI
jgi:hypothetical protein